jgi:spore coat protein JB
MSFSAFDLHLFLNTNPHNQRALMMFNNFSQKAKILKDNYERMYGPLTASSSNSYPWQWIQSPWPWEC